MANIPPNLGYVQTLGDFSICEVTRQKIRRGFPSGEIEILQSAKNSQEQLPESTFKKMFVYAIGEALRHNDFHYNYLRVDLEGQVTENGNNRPYDLRAGAMQDKHFNVFGKLWSQTMGGENRH